MTDRSQWKPLSPAFKEALRRYERSSRVRLRRTEADATVTAPLYHYTDRRGLGGIITTQQFWFTHYQHLNDDTELKFGMDVAKAVLTEIGARSGKVKLFCDMVIDLFSHENMSSTFDFYIASFSRNADSSHQWMKYAQHGQGFAIGIAPKLFAIENKAKLKPHENVFVAPVCYGDIAGRSHHLPAIENTARIVAETVIRKAEAMADINRGMPFFDELGKTLIASELILNCLTLKHQMCPLNRGRVTPGREARYRQADRAEHQPGLPGHHSSACSQKRCRNVRRGGLGLLLHGVVKVGSGRSRRISLGGVLGCRSGPAQLKLMAHGCFQSRIEQIKNIAV